MTKGLAPMPRISVLFFAVSLFLPAPSQAESVEEFLRAFHQDPARMMDRLPSEVDQKGEAQPRGFIDEKKVKERLSTRNEIRALIRERGPKRKITKLKGLNTLGLPEPNPQEKDRPEILIDPGTKIITDIREMQARGLMGISAPVLPWADSYWPRYKGMIGHRYEDPGFPESKIWLPNYQYVQANPASAIASSGNATLVNLLSPAEKYDLVMGDSDFTMTRFSWSIGKSEYEAHGVVPTWEGICHGWAAAAHMGASFVDRPVVVQSPSGTPVTFYPQDVKALMSMLWAYGAPKSRFVGNHCEKANPERNQYGRIKDPTCFDPNPATFHLALVNQMGVNGRSFVIDTTFDEIWNFPLSSAHYGYFNPKTFESTDVLKEAVVPLADLKTDFFREYRSPAAKYVVGIYMDLTYVIEIEPRQHKVFEVPTRTTRYIYDLELDENYNVIGGEWYSNAHPDFLWSFEKDAQAMAAEDAQLLQDPWRNDGPIPMYWTEFARRASARGEPLYAFLRKLLESTGNLNYTGPREAR